ncbi:phage terminase large subunit [Herbidospora daliensis]|uniref:phage terminase large subunit n=1 Tax=Herbidospora daliensis TaxID=295585 RepID=UPI0007846615|nr:phage terminase large subunit [Herbidospora daliensis]
MTTQTVIRFEPRGAAKEAFARTDPELLLSGAAGTGKSVGALYKVFFACLMTPRVRALIVRKTHASLTASTLVTFREKIAAEAIEHGYVRWYGGSGSEPASFKFRNGSVVVVGGLDRATRLLSTEYDLCFIDEAIECTEEDIDTIVTRLRNGRLSYQQLIMATNPGPPTHHLKIRADEGRAVMLYSKHEDNPRMHDGTEWTEYGRDYLTRLESLTGARYHRMRWGKWVANEGIIYEGWDPSVHVVDRFVVPDDWTRYWTVDFGYVNAFVCQMWAEDPDGRLFMYREHYSTKKTVDEMAEAILETVTKPNPDFVAPRDGSHVPAHRKRGEWTEPMPRLILADHDAEGRAVLERELGRSTRAAKKAVLDGIQAVQQRMKVASDGRPRLFLLRDSRVARDQELADAKKPTSTEEEIPGYVWDVGAGKNPKEQPLKDGDHGCDAMRYLVLHRDPRNKPSIRVMK